MNDNLNPDSEQPEVKEGTSTNPPADNQEQDGTSKVVTEKSSAVIENDAKAAVAKLQQEQEKVKKFEKDLEEERERSKGFRQSLERVDTWAKKDVQRYKEALIEVNGLTQEQANAEVQRVQATQQPPQAPGNVQAPYDPIQSRMRQNAEREIQSERDALENFSKEHKEDLNQKQLEMVAYVAGNLLRDPSTNLKPDEALNLAYKRNIKTEDLIQEARDESRLEGLATAASLEAGKMSSPTGKASQGSNEPQVPADEWKQAQEVGFTDKAEWIIYRDNPKVQVPD